MARVDPDDLADRNPARVYVAGTLDEARRVEELLTSLGVEYAVQIEPYVAGLFARERNGAMFYVGSAQADYCRSKLSAAGWHGGVVLEEE